MTERKAFFISGDRLTNVTHEKETLVIFDLHNDMVAGVETVNIKNGPVSTEELLFFLRRKHIRTVCVSEMDSVTESMFLGSGIIVETLLKLKEDRLYNSLYLSPPVFKEACWHVAVEVPGKHHVSCDLRSFESDFLK